MKELNGSHACCDEPRIIVWQKCEGAECREIEAFVLLIPEKTLIHHLVEQEMIFDGHNERMTPSPRPGLLKPIANHFRYFCLIRIN